MLKMQRLAERSTFPKPDTATTSNISARIPLQSAARTSLADSFSPGEAIAAAPLNKLNNNLHHQIPQGFDSLFLDSGNLDLADF